MQKYQQQLNVINSHSQHTVSEYQKLWFKDLLTTTDWPNVAHPSLADRFCCDGIRCTKDRLGAVFIVGAIRTLVQNGKYPSAARRLAAGEVQPSVRGQSKYLRRAGNAPAPCNTSKCQIQQLWIGDQFQPAVADISQRCWLNYVIISLWDGHCCTQYN